MTEGEVVWERGQMGGHNRDVDTAEQQNGCCSHATLACSTKSQRKKVFEWKAEEVKDCCTHQLEAVTTAQPLACTHKEKHSSTA